MGRKGGKVREREREKGRKGKTDKERERVEEKAV